MRPSAEIVAEIKKIQNQDARYNRVANEGGEGYERNSIPQNLLNELRASEDAEFAQKWTPEFTTKNRSAWNDKIRSLGQEAALKQLKRIEGQIGFSMHDLKKAIKLNNL